MYNTIGIQIIGKQCPKGRTYCPAKEYLKTQKLLQPTVNESIYAMTEEAWKSCGEFVAVLTKVHDICVNCK